MNADGWAERTTWVRGGDGFLVRDLNANGTIDNVNEMFGNATTAGLTALAALDSNTDGKISVADTAFGTLRMWIDADQDGVADAGELKTLAELDIKDISLTPTGGAGLLRGNTVRATGTFTRNDNSTGTTADVLLSANPADTVWLGDKTISTAAAALPEVKAFGLLTDLRVQMTDDATLLTSVTNFKNMSASSTWSALQTAAAGIMFRWAGVDAVPPVAMTAAFDRQKLAFLEKWMGTQLTPRDVNGNPDLNNVAELVTAWNQTLGSVTVRLAVQGPLQATFPGITYNATTDRLTAATPTALADGIRNALQTLSTDPATALSQWTTNWGPIFKDLAAAMVRSDTNIVKNDYTVMSLVRAMDGLTQPLTLAQLVTGIGLPNVSVGTSGADSFSYTGTGLDAIVMVGGGGNDTLTGSGGQTIYVVGQNFGQDTIIDLDPAAMGDRIRFALHSQNDVTITRLNNDLVISVNNSTDKLTVQNYFLKGALAANYGIEEIQFADGTLLATADVAQLVGKGTAAAETLTGTSSMTCSKGLPETTRSAAATAATSISTAKATAKTRSKRFKLRR